MERINTLRRFLEKDLWRINEDESQSAMQRSYYLLLKKLVLTIQRFINDRLVNRAAALTYTTMLATVPILAIVFAIARGFGFSKVMEKLMRESFQGHDTAIDALLESVNTYIQNTHSGLFIGIGFIMLIWTVLILTSNIENAFNAIWQVKKPRGAFRKFTDYFSLLLLFPLLLVFVSGFSIFMATIVKELPDFILLGATARFLLRLAPYLFTGILFTGLYIFMPNTHVGFRHALVPGLLAGAAFQGLQYFYINSQLWISNYNAIYGSFAAIPMFLIWTQISWCICLFGAELSYANQNVDYYNFEYDIRHTSRQYHDFVTLLILSAVCKRFAHPEAQPYTANTLAAELKLPLRMVNNLLYELTELHWLVPVTPIDDKSGEEAYLPSRDLEQIRVKEVLLSIHHKGHGNLNMDMDHLGDQWKKYLDIEQHFTNVPDDLLLKEF